ncbi:MAG: type II toxin-antitoxin system MqsA family antitoxin [Anaerolineae bacterium]|nr:type II toxin-antitoxin system MqsA family antitoxin [Anaerolineae bacterium]
MLCDICGKEGAQHQRITRVYGKGESLLVIENVPAIVCPNCGQSYLTAETLRQLEYIKLNRKNLAVARPVEVATFAL